MAKKPKPRKSAPAPKRSPTPRPTGAAKAPIARDADPMRDALARLRGRLV